MKDKYILVADADCEIPLSWVDEYDIVILPMPFTIEGVEYAYDLGKTVKLSDFYQKMRQGAVATTAQANPEDFKELFVPYLEQGKDILYLGVSSALSGTVNNAELAAAELLEQYKERQIVAVDTLAISMPMGYLVKIAAEMRLKGAALQEVADHINSIRQQACAFFTVDNLVYLKRGGRVSGAAAFFGTLLEVKPLLHISTEGKLVPCGKVKGRKNAIKQLASLAEQYAKDAKESSIYLLNAECEKDAEALKALVMESCNPKEVVSVAIGPVIGAHAGPGTLGIVFLAESREINPIN